MKHESLATVGLSIAVLLVASSASNAQGLDTVTMKSPNEDSFGKFGAAVSGAGDIDQDGFADVIVGAAGEGPNGRAYVLSIEDGRQLLLLTSPNDLEGGGAFGESVAGAGDVNGDGFADVIVGAPGEDPGTSPGSAGRAHVFSGRDGSLLFELESPNEVAFGNFGIAVDGAGDVNADGLADVIVGTWDEDPKRAYVFSGLDGSLLFQLASPDPSGGATFGSSASGAGDVNQDGFADVIVGDDREAAAAGRAYIFSGHTGKLLFTLVSPNEESFGLFGGAVAGAGDVNQDGHPDLIVGAPFEQSPVSAGRAYVFNGDDGSLLLELVSPNAVPDGLFGYSVGAAGDVNRDGFPDLIAGAPWEQPGGIEEAGRAYVFSGRNGGALYELESRNPQQWGHYGWSVDGVGDLNQDGWADLIVGAEQEWPAGSPAQAGRAYVFVSSGPRINSGGPSYTDANGKLFPADQAYARGGYGYVGGKQRTFGNPIGGTNDDPLYQSLRFVREGSFAYRFEAPAAGTYQVTLYLMAPELSGPGKIIMDVRAEGAVVLNDMNVSAVAGGIYRALTRTFNVSVVDGRLDLSFAVVNKAAVVSAISVVPPPAMR